MGNIKKKLGPKKKKVEALDGGELSKIRDTILSMKVSPYRIQMIPEVELKRRDDNFYGTNEVNIRIRKYGDVYSFQAVDSANGSNKVLLEVNIGNTETHYLILPVQFKFIE